MAEIAELWRLLAVGEEAEDPGNYTDKLEKGRKACPQVTQEPDMVGMELETGLDSGDEDWR